MKVVKFGGTSIADVSRIKRVIDIVKSLRAEGQLAVVVSALGGVTEKLISLTRAAEAGDREYATLFDELRVTHKTIARELISSDSDFQKQVDAEFQRLAEILQGIFLVRECSPRLLDLAMSFGERLSARLIAAALNQRNVVAEYVDASQLVKTDDQFGDATVDYATTYTNIRAYFFEREGIQIVTGFLGSTSKNEVTTLGRSGSDYTASLVGAALQCEQIEIWTDVNGLMTSDPRLVPDAFPIEQLTYEEAMEMSHFGSTVIHPKAMQPALETGIPIIIKNTFNPEFAGTVISKNGYTDTTVTIKGISSISNVALLRVHGSGMLGTTGVSGRLFSALAAAKINVILITQCSSEHSICLAVQPDLAARAKQMIEKAFELEILAHHVERVIQEDDMSIIAVVGEKMRGTPGIAAKIFQSLGDTKTNVVAIAQGSSELNVSIVVNRRDEGRALCTIHRAFFKNDCTPVSLFLVGTGVVGAALLEQLEGRAGSLRSGHGIDIRVHAIVNSRNTLFDDTGAAIKKWRGSSPGSRMSTNLKQVLERVSALGVKNKVLVDCTASAEVCDLYEQALATGISVVTANKLAASSAYERYRRLKDLTSRNGTKFCYETNVGAGLPILRTISDLVLSGDEIISVEGLLSGTLSFLFNAFDGQKPFSEVLREAQNLGYTEPDPREDLRGNDVARKILVIAREAGLPLEFDEIGLQSLLPASCEGADSLKEFFECLKRRDPFFDKRHHEAKELGEVLRYIATLEGNKAQVSLRSVGREHPFFSLTGSENVVVIKSKRYCDHPLVIRGPGAGAEVTAAGVLADILRTVN